MPKQVSIAELLRQIPRGANVFIAGSAGEPRELTSTLAETLSLAEGAHFVTSFVPGINGLCVASKAGRRRMQVFFMQDAYRSARQDGLVEFYPMSYSGIQQHLQSADQRIDCVLVQVSEPGADGLCSLGPSVEFMPSVLAKSRQILAVVNSNLPNLQGSPKFDLAACSHYTHSNAALATYDAGTQDETSAQIAAHLSRLIPDGASLQVGLGKIPAQLAPALFRHRDLAFHTGMLSDSILDLARAGALRKDRPLTSTVVVGSPALYSRLFELPDLRLEPVSVTHDPVTLAQIPMLYAINSAIEVDLLGQVNAEMVSGRYVSGPGGLPDFARAGRRCSNGMSVIALPAADRKGRHSRIVPRFAAGTPVTVSQHDVDAIVTEYGVAHIGNVSLEERVRRLSAIAHPDHRDELMRAGLQLLENA